MRLILLILLVCTLSGCEQEPLQFLPQDHYYTDPDEPIDYDYRADVIVTVSLPTDNLEAIQAVDQYIDQNYQEKEILKYNMFRLLFFKESSDTKRVYEPWDEYVEYLNGGSQVPRFNPDDVILEITWNQKIREEKPWAFRAYNFRNRFGNGCPYRIGIWLDEKDFQLRDTCSDEQRTAVEQYFKGARADKIW